MLKWWLSSPLLDEKDDSDGSSGADDKSDEKDSSGEDKGESGEEEEEDEDEEEEEVKEAKALYKLLKDPATQKSVIQTLAEKAGVLGTATSTKEVKEDTKTVLAILTETLGDEYKFLNLKLAPAIEKILEKERETHQKSTAALESRHVEAETDRAYERLSKETKGDFDKHKAHVSALADQLYPAPGQSVYDYVRKLYLIASSERRGQTAKQEMADKIKRNAKNATERLHSGGSSSTQTGGETAPKGLKAIVSAALESVTASSKKG